MNIRGYFMLLMSTIWRTVVTQLLATFRYRVAGGSDNALLPERKGRAILQKVYGKTVKFNQMNYYIDQTATAEAGDTALGVDNNRYGYNVQYYRTHKYFFKAKITTLSAGADIVIFGGIVIPIGVVTDYEYKAIKTISSDVTRSSTFAVRARKAGETTSGGKYGYEGLNLIDLTEIFGQGNEPSTVEEVEAWLALNVGAQDYYPYDEGSLVSFKGSGVKVTGWNKFHVVNGSGVADVKKGVKYYVAGPFGSLHYSDGTAISVASDRTFTAIKDDTITFGSVSNSIVLNIYTGTAKDGTYEPYHEEVVDLSWIYDLKIPNTSTDLFPNGLHSVGNAVDEVTPTTATVNVFRAVIPKSGFQVWSTGNSYYKTNGIPYACNVSSGSYIPNAISPNMIIANANSLYAADRPGVLALNGRNVYISDTDYNDPNITSFEVIYQLATPITIPHDTPMQYKVDKYSTEELLVPASAAGEPTSTAIVADIEYQAK